MGILLLALTMILSACGGDEPSSRADLHGAYDSKLEELRVEEEWADCDSALWAGLARAAGADWIDVSRWVASNGRPTRLPDADCDLADSASTTSNDMITGIMLGLNVSGDSRALQQMWDYGYSHNWIMGFPEYYLSRVLLRPNGITLLARSLHSLNDETDYGVRHLPVVYGPVAEDYEVHLQIISLDLQQRLGDPSLVRSISQLAMCSVPSRDAYREAVCGRRARAAELLLGDYKYPSYVRGHENYRLVHWLLAARVALSAEGRSNAHLAATGAQGVQGGSD